MTWFWIAALAMLAVALALVIPPVAVARGARGPSHADVRRAVYREQVQELQAQLDAGSLDAESYRQAREELDREFLDELREEPAAPAATHTHPYRAAIVAVLVPLAAGGLYLTVGTPGALLDGAPQPADSTVPSQAGSEGMPPIEEMVASLEQRLQREPGDAEGWVMLARSYQVMQRPVDVYRVLKQALVHHPRDPVVLVLLAEAMATRNGNRLDGEPMEYVNRALALRPNFARALWLAGIHEINQGNPSAALDHWEQVLEKADLAPGARAQIEQAVADAREQAGIVPPAGGSPSTAAGAVEVTVTVADALVSRVTGDETLYVFARAAEGPPMPLAAHRLSAGALPVTVVLDDSTAMSPELRLSQFDPVIVTARLSRSGTPSARSGDLQGVSRSLSPAASPKVKVVIDQVVE